MRFCALLLVLAFPLSLCAQENNEKPDYLSPEFSVEERVDDLVSRMTLEEKVSQMYDNAPAIPQLNIPEYDWWNECLHGVGRAGRATVFPQAIGLAATWNPELIHEMADVISTEARAKHHEAVRQGDRGRYKGLTFWSPNINIFRDPRWGRGQETYGEDPFLTSRIGVAFVKGLQGDHPKYLKLVATPKHYAVHSGPEPERHEFNAVTNKRDLYDTYLPAFEACIREGGAFSVMCAYNAYNGEPCCASSSLQNELLRKDWGFEGYIVSDCGAIDDIMIDHKVAETEPETAALAVKGGTDLNCGDYRNKRHLVYASLVDAVAMGLITEEEIDVSVKRLMTARFRLGMFDPQEMVPYAQIPYGKNDSEEHRKLSVKVAQESIVLLKNNDSLLPLIKELETIAVIGPTADSYDMLVGNYNGEPSKYVTPLQGIRNKLPNTEILFEEGCNLVDPDENMERFDRAIELAEKSDVVIFVGGITARLEGEETKRASKEGFRSGDRIRIDLPDVQQQLLRALQQTGKPVVLVLTSGSALAVNWAKENIPAIVQLWYPGQEGGTALADVLFGDYNPAGRLPVTFYKSVDQLPEFTDYSMKGRTYRYFQGDPLYPFGYGLSYTRFDYANLEVSHMEDSNEVKVWVRVKNTGDRAGDEVVQIYLKDLKASARVPIHALQGLKRIHLAAGESDIVEFTLTPRQLAVVTEEGRYRFEPGEYTIFVGGAQPGTAPDSTEVISQTIEIDGSPYFLN